MFGPANSKSSGGFTLLEVMTATMIVTLISVSIYRLLTSQLHAIQVSQDLVEDHHEMESLVRFLQAELGKMPPHGENQLLGTAHVFHGEPSDEITWLCEGGEGVLTSAAPGRYRVSLAVQPTPGNSSELELGLRRQRLDSGFGEDMDFYSRGTAGSRYSWAPLLHSISAMEVRYFDRRINAWVEAWNDPVSYPQLVRLRLWRHAGDAPFEAVISIPSSNVSP
jgi:prepilin-type N-terminal cleavage/methylation domain-containing protein